MTKSILASKTFWINLVIAAGMILGDQAVLAVIPEGWTPIIAAIVAGINIVLRLSTSQPVALKPPRT